MQQARLLAKPSAAPRPARPPVAGSTLPYRRVQSVCSDPEFVAVLRAFRPSGGLAAAEDLLATAGRGSGHGAGCGPELAMLARRIVARQVLSFAWQARTWLPRFQFGPDGLTPRRELAPLLVELSAVLDDWEATRWFVSPNAELDGCAPVAVLDADLPAVLRAARAVQPPRSRGPAGLSTRVAAPVT